MKLKPTLELSCVLRLLPLALAIFLHSPSARANVYATDIRLDGGTTNVTAASGGQVTISYILNEAASAGVDINIASGASVVRKISLAAGNPGTDRGLNSVTWDGLDNNSNNAAGGTYQVSITAASAGYTNWTQITSEDDPGAYVYLGSGIAVDRNPTSPYYGRVFVANSAAGPTPATTPGDVLGILKLNADATFAEEIPSSGGLDGRDWAGNGLSPWQVRVSDDEFVYVSDLATSGEVLRWDPTLSSNSLVMVLRSDNIPSGAQLSGPAIVGTGTNTQIWMADMNGANGIVRWHVTATGTCATNDLGKSVVGLGADPTNNLTLGPISVALDKSGNIYTCQVSTNTDDPTSRVFRFPAYDPSTNNGSPETLPDWAVGANDDTYAAASAVAVDPTGTYVAAAFQGLIVNGLFQGGNTKVLYATNGALAANLDLGLAIGGDAEHQDTACDWDAVGNVYCVDNWFGKWRAFSPPGINQATTVGLATIQVTGGSTGGGPAPTITKISVAGTTVTIDFTATANDVASSFLVVGSGTVTGPYSTVANATIALVSPGVFRATLSSSSGMQYYKIQRQGGPVQPPGQAPLITSLAVSNGTATLTFTGSTSDSASQFTLLSATVATGPYASATGANITLVSGGVFRATVPATGPVQFYRLQR